MEILGWVFVALLAVIALIAVGLGLRSIPDARRYLKIRHMQPALGGVVASRILVAGIGNIFLGDDGFGPEVLRHVPQHLAELQGVRLTDYGIGGMHLAYDLLDGWDALVLVDALPNCGSPGSVHVFEADHGSLQGSPAIDAHGMDPPAVFASLRALGGEDPRTIVVGCEVADVTDGIGLSAAVESAVPGAVAAVESAVTMLRTEDDGVREV